MTNTNRCDHPERIWCGIMRWCCAVCGEPLTDEQAVTIPFADLPDISSHSDDIDDDIDGHSN